MRAYGTTNAAPYATAPAVGLAGDTYFNTTSKILYVSDGTSWIALAVGGAAVNIRRIGSAILTASPGQSGISTITDITGASVTWTANNLRHRATYSINVQQITAGGIYNVTLANAANTALAQPGGSLSVNNYDVCSWVWEGVLAAGSQTLKLRAQTSGGTISINQGATTPTILIVDEVP